MITRVSPSTGGYAPREARPASHVHAAGGSIRRHFWGPEWLPAADRWQPLPSAHQPAGVSRQPEYARSESDGAVDSVVEESQQPRHQRSYSVLADHDLRRARGGRAPSRRLDFHVGVCAECAVRRTRRVPDHLLGPRRVSLLAAQRAVRAQPDPGQSRRAQRDERVDECVCRQGRHEERQRRVVQGAEPERVPARRHRALGRPAGRQPRQHEE